MEGIEICYNIGVLCINKHFDEHTAKEYKDAYDKTMLELASGVNRKMIITISGLDLAIKKTNKLMKTLENYMLCTYIDINSAVDTQRKIHKLKGQKDAFSDVKYCLKSGIIDIKR